MRRRGQLSLRRLRSPAESLGRASVAILRPRACPGRGTQAGKLRSLTINEGYRALCRNLAAIIAPG